jgi:hypothetical protein
MFGINLYFYETTTENLRRFIPRRFLCIVPTTPLTDSNAKTN